jgi:signal transduction histidine kinase
LFSIIGHDLKNPFGGVLSMTEILEESISRKDFETSLSYVKIVKEATNKGYGLLINLLDWARAQTGKIQFNPVRYNFWEQIDEVLQVLGMMGQEKHIQIDTQLDKNFEILADKNMLTTILRNVISNAIKFSNKCGRITISAHKYPETYKIIVEDTGIGIKQEKIEKLFRLDHHVTTEGTASETGTGLGLLICKDFVDRHGGDIHIESKEGEGTRFSLDLPVRQQKRF